MITSLLVKGDVMITFIRLIVIISFFILAGYLEMMP